MKNQSVKTSLRFLLILLVGSTGILQALAFVEPTPPCRQSSRNGGRLLQLNDYDEDNCNLNRRKLLLSFPATAVCFLPTPSLASNAKSRTDGYAFQKTDAEWKTQLSDMQYFVLRQGGTESPNYSILEGEDRPGTFVCAGCGTELFASTQKFHSGTGWPSFARALPGVEVEDVNPITANLVGAELRCRSCGGHLGDVFNDGYLFVGSPAFASGKRYCIDGAALIFRPDQPGESNVRGDTKKPQQMPSWLEPPKINATT